MTLTTGIGLNSAARSVAAECGAGWFLIAGPTRTTCVRGDVCGVSIEDQAASFVLPHGEARGDAIECAAGNVPMRRALWLFAAYYLLLSAFLYWMDAIIPDKVSVTFFGHAYSSGNIHHHIVAVGMLGFVVVPTAFLIELLVTGWPNSSLCRLFFERSRSSQSDLIVFGLRYSNAMNVASKVLTFGVALISGLWIHDWLLAATGIDFGFVWMPPVFAFLAYLLLFTFFDYWAHRLDHTRYFWPLHRYHHSAEDFYVLTASRVNPGAISSVVVIAIPLGILAMPPETGFWIFILVEAERMVIHSRIDSDFGWIGRFVIQSPVHHRLHHSLDTSRPVAHFSLLPVWDHLFGTWQGGGSQSIAIGVDYPYRHGLWVLPDLWRDYCEFVVGFFRRGPA
jgi:sterol desaturase/sphingolipid hydroxylase (fatty acid hydroxylase superfamily)